MANNVLQLNDMMVDSLIFVAFAINRLSSGEKLGRHLPTYQPRSTATVMENLANYLRFSNALNAELPLFSVK